MKGVIRLQAIIRGQAVRRQVSKSLQNFPSNARNRLEILERSSHAAEHIKQNPKQKKKLEDKELKVKFVTFILVEKNGGNGSRN